MKIVIPGGSGQVGSLLARAFVKDGHEVVILSRTPRRDGPCREVEWDARSMGSWASELEGADAVINLAGRSVNCRYGAANRRAIKESRVESTRIVGQCIRQAARPPRVWLQASTATIYSHRYDAPNDELKGIIGGAEPGVPETWRFSIDVATSWERAVLETQPLPQTRTVLMRSAIAFSPDAGGAFDTLLALVRFGLGGQVGDGRQYVSWIHEADFVRAVYWLIANDSIRGPVNLASPNPLPNAEFMRALREAWGIHAGLPVAPWMLELGAVFMRTETELILKSRRVTPALLTQHGFTFEFPDWPAAARELCERWRQTKLEKGATRPS